MATRCTIAMETANGAVHTIYCHSDGYRSWVGRKLYDRYNYPAIVARLIGLGRLSCLGEEIGEAHDMDWRSGDEWGYGTWKIAHPEADNVFTLIHEAQRKDPRYNWCRSHNRDHVPYCKHWSAKQKKIEIAANAPLVFPNLDEAREGHIAGVLDGAYAYIWRYKGGWMTLDDDDRWQTLYHALRQDEDVQDAIEKGEQPPIQRRVLPTLPTTNVVQPGATTTVQSGKRPIQL